MATKSKYKLYLFDLDGTLLDSDEMLRVTFHTLYKLYKPEYKIDDIHILTLSGPQIRDTLRQEFPDQDQELMLSEWRKYSNINYVKCSKLYPGANELLRKMAKENIPFSIITNKHRGGTDYTLKLMGLDDLNIFCVCADEAGKLKPEPEGIYMAMEHFGITNKDDVVYIGDSVFDYLTAKNAGVDFGFVGWSPRKLPEDAEIDLLIADFDSWAKDL